MRKETGLKAITPRNLTTSTFQRAFITYRVPQYSPLTCRIEEDDQAAAFRKIDNEPHYKEVLKQHPILGVN